MQAIVFSVTHLPWITTPLCTFLGTRILMNQAIGAKLGNAGIKTGSVAGGAAGTLIDGMIVLPQLFLSISLSACIGLVAGRALRPHLLRSLRPK